MCGIAGLDARTLSPMRVQEIAAEMVASLHHRGPDDRGFHHSGSLAMGMTRLSIVDVAGGHQPISSEDGEVTVVCNGEIYNHLEVRRELENRGHKFRTNSDVEVLVHLYEDYGDRAVRHLQGMFAFALWDARRRKLVLGRDRLGIKPLYYAIQNEMLFFGSELKALVRPRVLSLDVDEVAIDRFLTFGYVPSPMSIYKQVRKLEPGHILVWENGKASFERYWTLSFNPVGGADERELADHFLTLFRQAVGSHLMGEVPLGAFLSGGLDSSLMVALMSEASSQPVRTFTMGFGGSAGKHFDERPYARMVSDRYATRHTEFEVEPRIDDVLEKAVDAFDEPFADDSVVPSFYICRLAKQEVTVALTGLGGDELFGGYQRYLGLELSRRYERVPRRLRQLVAPAVNLLPERKNGHHAVNHIKRFIRSSDQAPARRYLEFIAVVTDPMKKRLYRGLPLSCAQGMNAAARFEAGPNAALLDQALFNDIATYLPDDILALTDRLSMLQSLELRVPFLDHLLVEFCATIPAHLKVKGLTKKYLLRRVAAPFLPEPVLGHRKQGFGSPLASWLRHELRDYIADSLAPPRLAQHGLFDANVVRHMIDQHSTRQESQERPLFALLMFQKWWDRFQ